MPRVNGGPISVNYTAKAVDFAIADGRVTTREAEEILKAIGRDIRGAKSPAKTLAVLNSTVLPAIDTAQISQTAQRTLAKIPAVEQAVSNFANAFAAASDHTHSRPVAGRVHNGIMKGLQRAARDLEIPIGEVLFRTIDSMDSYDGTRFKAWIEVGTGRQAKQYWLFGHVEGRTPLAHGGSKDRWGFRIEPKS